MLTFFHLGMRACVCVWMRACVYVSGGALALLIWFDTHLIPKTQAHTQK